MWIVIWKYYFAVMFFFGSNSKYLVYLKNVNLWQLIKIVKDLWASYCNHVTSQPFHSMDGILCLFHFDWKWCALKRILGDNLCSLIQVTVTRHRFRFASQWVEKRTTLWSANWPIEFWYLLYYMLGVLSLRCVSNELNGKLCVVRWDWMRFICH